MSTVVMSVNTPDGGTAYVTAQDHCCLDDVRSLYEVLPKDTCFRLSDYSDGSHPNRWHYRPECRVDVSFLYP